jgi:hypothetical protein
VLVGCLLGINQADEAQAAINTVVVAAPAWRQQNFIDPIL